MNNSIKKMLNDIDVFGTETAKAVFAMVYRLCEEGDDPITGVEHLIDAVPDKQVFYNCYSALMPQLEPVQRRFGHAELMSSVCEYYGLAEPDENPFLEEKLRMKYSPDDEGFDGTGKGFAQDIDYAFENSMTDFGNALRQEVLENASDEAKELFHDLEYDPVVIADASKQTAEEWHASRMIGGSSISALTGSSKYHNAYGLYMQLTGAEVKIELSEEELKRQKYIFDFGHQAEKWIAQAIEVLPSMAEFRGCKVLVDTRIFSFENREDYLSVNLDGILQWPDGHFSIAEFKSPGYFMKKYFEDNNVPQDYYDQVQAQMMMTNIDDAYLFGFFSRDEITASRVVRDLDHQKYLLERVDDFYFNHIVPMIPPENEGSGQLVMELDRRYNGKRNNKLPKVDINPCYLDDVREASELNELRKAKDRESRALKAQFDEKIAQVLVSMGAGAYGVLEDGNDRFTVKYTERDDSPKFKKENMDRLKREKPDVHQMLIDEKYITYSGGGPSIDLKHEKIV